MRSSASATPAAASPEAPARDSSTSILCGLAFILVPFFVCCERQGERAVQQEAGRAQPPAVGAAAPPDASAVVALAAARPREIAQGLAAPESALYDADQDVYFISNINGAPADEDDNGYIARISAEDGEAQPRWIDGAGSDVTLDAPKGMAIVGEDLWVADIHVLRRFDRRSGDSRGDVAIPGSVFLNDLAAGADGSVYVSDTAIAVEGSAARPTGADAIYRVGADGSVEKILSGAELKQPNGLEVDGDRLWVVTYGGNSLLGFAGGKQVSEQALPRGQLDGLLRLPDGSFAISSWEARGVYRGPAQGPFTLVVEDTDAPADLGFDARRGLLLVPQLMKNAVALHAIAPAAPVAR